MVKILWEFCLTFIKTQKETAASGLPPLPSLSPVHAGPPALRPDQAFWLSSSY